MRKIADLIHPSVDLPSGGKVFGLNTGEVITSEDACMLQAKYSRDPKGFLHQIKDLITTGPGKFMSKYYVGYGHKSIGDCASKTLFIDGLSMLAAKAIQHSQLYNGQECSTRYIDFSDQLFFDSEAFVTNPIAITSKLRSFYLESMPVVIEDLKNQFPKKESDDEKTYNNAIRARAFDILRGFLPAGAMTNIAVTMTIRQFGDHLLLWRNHPLQEVRDIADACQTVLEQLCPNSFGHKKYEATENYYTKFQKAYTYWDSRFIKQRYGRSDFNDQVICLDYGIELGNIPRDMVDILLERPQKTELPKMFNLFGASQFGFMLDFGCLRDIFRQRSVNWNMPLLTPEYGFETWYLENLPDEIRLKAQGVLVDFEDEFTHYSDDPIKRQYVVPMGYKVPIIMCGGLSSLVYIIELRASSRVHPALQKVASNLGQMIKEEIKIPVHFNPDETGRFDVKRGKDTIEKK